MGILAHVDAGKTTLTERLLFDAGVIDRMGDVDRGSTQTDSMELERQRGITIRSAVVSFTVDDLKINLIDTPGHPDFIAEVERSLRVLDDAVLVISAVEGVQPQTRILMRTLQRLQVPTLLFVNKIDRMGARYGELLDSIARTLTPGAVVMSGASGLGTRGARVHPHTLDDGERREQVMAVLAEHNDSLLASYLAGDRLSGEDLRRELAAQTATAVVHPVFFGSALTGEGMKELVDGVRSLLPAAAAPDDTQLRGTVFKIEQSASGEKVAFVRLRSGSLRRRQRITFYGRRQDGETVAHRGKVSAISTFDRGKLVPAPQVAAGDIAMVWGLREARIGDQLGRPETGTAEPYFSPPTLETVARAANPSQQGLLYMALRSLAEQDPFIDTRIDDLRHEISVSLYGEVQKEVITDRLTTEFGVTVVFEETRPLCIERPAGVGEAFEQMSRDFRATIGLRVEPSSAGTGVQFRLGVERGSLLGAFLTAIEETVVRSLRQGLYGWPVEGCVVTLTHSGYDSVVSTAADFRELTPLVLMAALRRAGTRVYEPINHFDLDLPPETASVVLSRLAEIGATPQDAVVSPESGHLEGVIPAGKVHDLQRRLPALTGGAGTLLSRFSGFSAVSGTVPRRKRSDGNPLNRSEYMLRLRGRM